MKRLAIDEAELRAAIARGLEQSPQCLQSLLDVMTRGRREGHPHTHRLDQVANKNDGLADAHHPVKDRRRNRLSNKSFNDPRDDILHRVPSRGSLPWKAEALSEVL